MNNILAKEEIIREIEFLPAAFHQMVLDYIRTLSLSNSPRADSTKTINQLIGLLTPEEAADMIQNIEKECERIDINEW